MGERTFDLSTVRVIPGTTQVAVMEQTSVTDDGFKVHQWQWTVMTAAEFERIRNHGV